MVRRYGLRDDQWEKRPDLLPGRADTVGGTARDNRLCGEAVLYRDRAGMPWRDVPERFGDWKKRPRRHRRGSEGGGWQRVCAPLAGDADKAYAMIDSTRVRAHQHGAGAQGGTQKPRASGAAQADGAPKDMPHAMRGVIRRAFP